MNNTWPWYAGIASVLIYITAVVIGGMLYPGYSHLAHDVSQLTSTNSPIRDFMNIFFIYNLLICIFGLGLYKISVNKLSRLGAASIISIGILGLIIGFFPINTRGTNITNTGMAHIVLVSIISFMTVVSGFLFWGAFRKTAFKSFARLSLFTGIGFLVSGPFASLTVMSPYAGLTERIPIGIFLFWIFRTSTIMLKERILN